MTRTEILQAIFDNWGPMKRSIHAYLMHHFSAMGLSPAQLEIIKTIHYCQPLSHKVLAKKMQLTPGGVTQLLEGLEEAGLIDRTPNPKDRRVVYLSLSSAGKRKLEEFHQLAKQLLSEVFTTLEDEELTAYLHVQQKLIEHLEQHHQQTHVQQED